MEIGGDRLKKKEDETGKRKHVPSTVYVGRDPFFPCDVLSFSFWALHPPVGKEGHRFSFSLWEG